MSQLDDFVSKLSDDELDTLNNSPELQAQLKAKYAPSGPLEPTSEVSLKGFAGNVGKDFVSQGISAVKTASDVAFPMSNLPSYKDIQQYPQMMKSMGQGIANAIENPVETAYKYPVSTTATLASGIAGIKGMPDLLPESIKSQIPDLVQKTTSLPQRATELEGSRLPTPTAEEIQSAIKNVQKTVSSVWKEHGDLLNSAKKELEMPTTLAEKENSLKKFGNVYGIDREIWKDPEAQKYLIDHGSMNQLAENIARFKDSAPNIAPATRAKLANYLQQQVGKFVDFSKPGGELGGVLKQQYGDLGNIISGSSTKLSAAKTKMGDLYDTVDNISKKLSGDPGEAEAYLRRLFTSKSPAVKDDIAALTKIDGLAGTNTLETLFKHFAGESYGKILGQSSHTIFQAPYALLTSPRYVISPLAKAARLAGFGIRGGIAGAGTGFTLGQMNPENNSELQSLRDRIRNNESSE